MNILCKLGFHKPYKDRYIRIRKRKGKHKWHNNYTFCQRCGKRLDMVSFHRKKVDR